MLEVIIATAILAASAMMLMSMFSTGERHARRADERTISQMLCQSKLDELLADPAQIMPVEAELFPHFPGWVYSVDIQPTSIDGFAQLHVAVTRIPGMPTGADLDVASAEKTVDVSSVAVAKLSSTPMFELTRWLSFDGNLDGFAAASPSATPNRRTPTGM